MPPGSPTSSTLVSPLSDTVTFEMESDPGPPSKRMARYSVQAPSPAGSRAVLLTSEPWRS